MATYNDTGTLASPYNNSDADDAFSYRRISWKAILAGTLLAIVVQIALSLLGIGIGASTIDPLVEANPTDGLGAAAGIWFVGTSILSLALGGWLAGRLTGFARHPDGTIHGVLTWALTSLVSFLLLSSAAGALLGGAASMVSRNPSILNNAAQSARNSVNGVPADASGVVSAMTNPGASNAAAPTTVNPADVPQTNPNLTAEQEARVREQADLAAERTAQTALWTFFGLVLGAIASGVGGYLGAARYHVLHRPKNANSSYATRGAADATLR